MRDGVMRLGQADLGIRAIDVFTRHHERGHARDVGLERQHLQIEHELGVFPEGGRHADRLLRHGEIAVDRLAFRDALFHVAHGVEIFAELGAVARAESAAEL